MPGSGRNTRHYVVSNPLNLMSLITDGPKEDLLTSCPNIAGEQFRTMLGRSDADAPTKLGGIPLHERSEDLGQDPLRLSPFVGDKGPHGYQSMRKVVAGPSLSLTLLA